MFKQLSDLTKAGLFTLLAIGLATIVSILTVALNKPNLFNFVMFTPLLAVLLMLLVVTPDGYAKAGWQTLGLQRLGLRGWPLAILLPFFLLATSFAITTLVGVAKWQLPANATWGQFILNLLAELLIGTLFAVGEEIGWRGYLLPKLGSLRPARAALLNGLLHGLWHLPMILLTPFYHGDGNRWIVIPLFLLTLTVAGIFYSYLRLTTNALWAVALGHGAFNTFWGMFTALTISTSPLWMEYLSGESGLITLILAIVAVGFLVRRLPANTTPSSLPAAVPVQKAQNRATLATLDA